MSKQKKKKDEIDPNAWLGTYSDTITLLLTFFVLLYSYSSVDAVKFKSMANAMQSVFSKQASQKILDFNNGGGEVPIVGSPIDGDQNSNSGENVKASLENLKKYVKDNKMESYVKIKNDSRGFIFEIKDKILFETGQGNLRKESLPVLDVVSKYIGSVKNGIIVEGHTDNVPISNEKFQDNLELSSERANNVTRYFINNKKLDPRRFQSIGLGEYHPIVPNNSEGNKAQNRRVNILIVTDNSKKEGK